MAVDHKNQSALRTPGRAASTKLLAVIALALWGTSCSKKDNLRLVNVGPTGGTTVLTGGGTTSMTTGSVTGFVTGGTVTTGGTGSVTGSLTGGVTTGGYTGPVAIIPELPTFNQFTDPALNPPYFSQDLLNLGFFTDPSAVGARLVNETNPVNITGSFIVLNGRLQPAPPGAWAMANLNVSRLNTLQVSEFDLGASGNRELHLMARHRTLNTSATTVLTQCSCYVSGRVRMENGVVYAEILKVTGELRATLAEQFSSGQILTSVPVPVSRGVMRFLAMENTLALYINDQIVGLAEDASRNNFPYFFGFIGRTDAFSPPPSFGKSAVVDLMPIARRSVIPLYSDGFTRTADASRLGMGWVEVQGDLNLVGGDLVPVTVGSPAVATLLTTAADGMGRGSHLADMDAFAEINLADASPTASIAGLVARYTAAPVTGSMYVGQLARNGAAYEAAIYLFSGGTPTKIAGVTLASFSGRGLLNFRARGPELKVFLNGEYLVGVNHTTLTRGSPGILLQNGARIGKYDLEAIR